MKRAVSILIMLVLAMALRLPAAVAAGIDLDSMSIEELQKQILDMKEAGEKNAAEMQALKDQLSKSSEDLKNARDLNAKLMNKVPGEDAPSSDKQDEDPYEGLSFDEMLSKMGGDIVDKVVAEMDAKNKK